MIKEQENTARCRRWRNSHRKKIREYTKVYMRQYRKDNRSKMNDTNRNYYHSHLEKMRVYFRMKNREWRAKRKASV